MGCEGTGHTYPASHACGRQKRWTSHLSFWYQPTWVLRNFMWLIQCWWTWIRIYLRNSEDGGDRRDPHGTLLRGLSHKEFWGQNNTQSKAVLHLWGKATASLAALETSLEAQKMFLFWVLETSLFTSHSILKKKSLLLKKSIISSWFKTSAQRSQRNMHKYLEMQ